MLCAPASRTHHSSTLLPFFAAKPCVLTSAAPGALAPYECGWNATCSLGCLPGTYYASPSDASFHCNYTPAFNPATFDPSQHVVLSNTVASPNASNVLIYNGTKISGDYIAVEFSVSSVTTVDGARVWACSTTGYAELQFYVLDLSFQPVGGGAVANIGPHGFQTVDVAFVASARVAPGNVYVAVCLFVRLGH